MRGNSGRSLSNAANQVLPRPVARTTRPAVKPSSRVCSQQRLIKGDKDPFLLVIGFAVLSIALSGSAFAQKPGVNFKGDKPPVDPKSEAEKKRIDQEYQSTLKAIPDQPQKKVDPWAKIRSPAPAQK